MKVARSERIGVMVCGHGSRNGRAVGEFSAIAEKLRGHFPDWPVEYGYLEFAEPVLRDGLDRLRQAGCDRILAVPGMLFAAGHAKNDIPSVLNTWQTENPGIMIDYGRELGIDPKMIAAAGDRIREVIESADDDIPLHETLLMVVGRGASDPDANANVAKIMRLLWEGFGFGWGETAYSGVTFPLVEPALEKAARLGFRRIVVFPYFLFTGVLVSRIYMAVDAVAARHPDIAFHKAGYLNDHPQVIATFAERVTEIIAGENLMNCQMCKYRTQVLGFEGEAGAAQQSHHHHVEGVGASCNLCDPDGTCNSRCQAEAHTHAGDQSEDHHHHDKGAHDHNDGHHHHPYPHAGHPLGPRSLKGR